MKCTRYFTEMEEIYMLENNTDRSFWMVGSIIVGSALITSAKPAFNAILTTITDWFKKMINDTSSKALTVVSPAISGILPNVIEAASKMITL